MPIGNTEPDCLYGCTNPNADNYNELATNDDGSCFISGCMDLEACNFDDTATIDNGSCEYKIDCAGVCGGTFVEDACDNCIDPESDEIPECEYGCWDLNACNFDETTTYECEGCCIYAVENFDCDGNCLLEIDCLGVCGGNTFVDDCGVCGGPGPLVWYFDLNNDGIPDPYIPPYISCDDPGDNWITDSEDVIVYGCIDPFACNYDYEANVNNNSCIYAEIGYDCEGNCLLDADVDGICDEFDDCNDFNNDLICDDDCTDENQNNIVIGVKLSGMGIAIGSEVGKKLAMLLEN